MAYIWLLKTLTTKYYRYQNDQHNVGITKEKYEKKAEIT